MDEALGDVEPEPTLVAITATNLQGSTPRCGVSGPRPDMHDYPEHDDDAMMRIHVISLNRQLREKEALLAGLSESDGDAVQQKALHSAILELKVLLREATAVQQSKRGEPLQEHFHTHNLIALTRRTCPNFCMPCTHGRRHDGGHG